jgi:4-hydroxybenzoate polyprenyltransferase
MRLSKQWGCEDKDLPEWYGPVFMVTVFGPVLVGIAIATAPVWGIAATAFLANNPQIPANAFWAVIKAIARKKNPVKAGAKAGINAAAVTLIVKWAKKYLIFL